MERLVKIILFSGKQGSGKTTSVDELRLWAMTNGWGFKSMKFADPLYAMHDDCLKILNNFGIETPKKDGKLLQLLGTDWGRETYGQDIWAKLGRKMVDGQIEHWKVGREVTSVSPAMIVIDDCRFINEVEIFPDAYKIRLECPRDVRKARTKSWRDNENHASETQFDGVDFARYFDAIYNTTPNLGMSSKEIVDQIAKNVLEVK